MSHACPIDFYCPKPASQMLPSDDYLHEEDIIMDVSPRVVVIINIIVAVTLVVGLAWYKHWV